MAEHGAPFGCVVGHFLHDSAAARPAEKRVTKTQKLNHRFGDCSQQNANYLDTGYMVSEQFWILAPLKSSNLLIDSAIFFLLSQKFKVFREKAATECNGLGFLRYSPLQKNNRQMSNQRQLNHFHFYKRPKLNFEIRKLEKFQILGNDCCLLLRDDWCTLSKFQLIHLLPHLHIANLNANIGNFRLK